MSSDATPRTNTALPSHFLAAHNSLLAELYVQAKASRWSLSREEFNAALYRSAAHRFGKLLPRDYVVEFYLRSLHLTDFAFACALQRGTAWAWAQFFEHYRPSLYSDSAAMAASQGNVHAREIVDALCDALHSAGPDADAPDPSALRDYHGRSKLTTWLRVLIAERHADAPAPPAASGAAPAVAPAAAQNKTAAQNKKWTAAPGAVPAAAPGPSSNLHGLTRLASSRNFWKNRNSLASLDPLRAPYLAALHRACHEAIAALPPSDRLFAALYYAERLDRSQMAQLQGVPEVTISRRLADIRLQLSAAISAILAAGIPVDRMPEGEEAVSALTPAQIDRCFTYALEEWQCEPDAEAGKARLLGGKTGVLRDLPHRRDNKSEGKESATVRDEVLPWLVAHSFNRLAVGTAPANAAECPAAELLSAYADRTLDADETARWELHFAACTRCRTILAACMAPEKQAAREEALLSSAPLLSSDGIPPDGAGAGTDVMDVIVPAAPTIPPAAHPAPNRSVRLVSRFALRWIAPILSLAIGAAIGLALHSPAPEVTSRFPSQVRPGDVAAGDDSQSTDNLSGPFAQTGTGADPDSSTPAGNWQNNRFVQVVSRELMSVFTQIVKLFDLVTVPPSAIARAARVRAANRSPRAGPRGAAASSVAVSLPTVFASPDGQAFWRVGSAGQIAYSADRGAHWQLQSTGVDADLFSGVATPDHGVWVLGRGGVILRSADGTQWRRISSPSSSNISPRPTAGKSSASAASGEFIRIVAADKLHATVTAADSRRFATANGGASWAAVP